MPPCHVNKLKHSYYRDTKDIYISTFIAIVTMFTQFSTNTTLYVLFSLCLYVRVSHKDYRYIRMSHFMQPDRLKVTRILCYHE